MRPYLQAEGVDDSIQLMLHQYLLVVAVASALSINAQTSASNFQQTAGLSNGRSWNAMAAEQKRAYVMGMVDVLASLKPQGADLFLSPRFTVDETVGSIDQIYSAPENVLIPVVFALRLAVLKFNGGSSQEFDAMIVGFRKAVSVPAKNP